MKIKSIRAFPLRRKAADVSDARRPGWQDDAETANPMSRYPRYRARRSSWRPAAGEVGCLVTAEDGSWGFATGRMGAPVVSLINDHLGRLLEGEPFLATERLWDMMFRLASPYSAAGLAAYAISAVDLALWDLKGRTLQRPVYELLGGPAREQITCYARPATTPTGTWSSASRQPSLPVPTVPPTALPGWPITRGWSRAHGT